MAFDDALTQETKMVNLAQVQRLENVPGVVEVRRRSFPAPCTHGQDAKLVLTGAGRRSIVVVSWIADASTE
jgi:hypothetical protein